MPTEQYGVEGTSSSTHLFAAVTAAHIGLDPAGDITWVASESATPWRFVDETKT